MPEEIYEKNELNKLTAHRWSLKIQLPKVGESDILIVHANLKLHLAYLFVEKPN